MTLERPPAMGSNGGILTKLWELPAPFLRLLILLRSGFELVGRRTVGFSFSLDDLVFVVLGLAVLLLLPVADRGAARPAFERPAPAWNRALCRVVDVAGPMDARPRHRFMLSAVL